MNYFQNILSFNSYILPDLSIVEEIIPSLVNDRMDTFLKILPSFDEISTIVFFLNNDSAPEPDDFGTSSFHNYWDIIK